MSYNSIVTYYRAASESFEPPTGYTLRTSSAPDAPFVTEFPLASDGNEVIVYGLPGSRSVQRVLMDLTGRTDWRGTIPAGTILETAEGTAATTTRCTVERDFTITDDSILTQTGDGSNFDPFEPHDPYQVLPTTNWYFVEPRQGHVQWEIVTPMRVGSMGVTPSVTYQVWVRFSDVATVLGGGFSEVAGQVNVRTSERVRTFSTDAFVADDWHEGDWIQSQSQWYQIQARRVLSSRELEFDAIAHPEFRLSDPPEGT